MDCEALAAAADTLKDAYDAAYDAWQGLVNKGADPAEIQAAWQVVQSAWAAWSAAWQLWFENCGTQTP